MLDHEMPFFLSPLLPLSLLLFGFVSLRVAIIDALGVSAIRCEGLITATRSTIAPAFLFQSIHPLELSSILLGLFLEPLLFSLLGQLFLGLILLSFLMLVSLIS